MIDAVIFELALQPRSLVASIAMDREWSLG